uniref:Rhodanese domain-containing protein n=1 Tax=viral metagenome TaxID=1070528 RepID=A0A6C0KWB6_9ZZZZ
MGNSISTQKINFEDMQTIYKNPESYILINTLPEGEQNCLIRNTITPQQEEALMNKLLRNGNKSIRIIVYGRNCNDETANKKYEQLLKLGFINTYIYIGGIFEWLLLQDIYGTDEFPTTSKQLDILKYKPCKRLNIALLENG